MRLLLGGGADPGSRPRGITPLENAIYSDSTQVIDRLLLERGADPSIRDGLFQAGADGWLHIFFATRWHDPVTRQLHDLIKSRSHLLEQAEGWSKATGWAKATGSATG